MKTLSAVALSVILGIYPVSHVSAAQPASRQTISSQQQAEIEKLHRSVMSVMGAESLEKLTDKDSERFLKRKLRTLPREARQSIRAYLERRNDPTGVDRAMFVIYWYMADKLQQQLSALPELKTAEAESLRRQWLSDAQSIDAAYSQKQESRIDMHELMENMSAVFQRYGLKDID